MTTRITVDAHAGWPVEVTTETQSISAGSTPEIAVSKQIVAANSVENFYIHDGMSITGIQELDRPDDPAPTEG